MFGAFTSFGKLGSLSRAIAAAWSPLALWPDGVNSPGMWISPSTLPASFNDYTGTTPVAVPGSVADSANPVGLALDIRAGATTVSDPGHHMLQATSAARPLLSAYDGQTLGPGNTYDATGYPIFQKYDGTDDGMATASFAAGTLINGMDCMIPVRRDSGANMICGLYEPGRGNAYFGAVSDGSTSTCMGPDVGYSWTILVDGTLLAGGTSVTQGQLSNALTVGEFHILEFRNIELNSLQKLAFGMYGAGWQFNGARGDILLFPSTASTEDKDKARQYLADKYGVTLA
jgi:hypothetical protein